MVPSKSAGHYFEFVNTSVYKPKSGEGEGDKCPNCNAQEDCPCTEEEREAAVAALSSSFAGELDACFFVTGTGSLDFAATFLTTHYFTTNALSWRTPILVRDAAR